VAEKTGVNVLATDSHGSPRIKQKLLDELKATSTKIGWLINF
jgi:hypothetical protein